MKNKNLQAFPWGQALLLLQRYEEAPKKFGDLLSSTSLQGNAYAQCRSLLLNVLKHRTFLIYCLAQNFKHAPKLLLKNFLLLASGDLWQQLLEKEGIIPESTGINLQKNGLEDDRETHASMTKKGIQASPLYLEVNTWVERAKVIFSLPEVGFINAILRRLSEFFCRKTKAQREMPQSIFFSTPEWLIGRWQKNFGVAAVEKLLTFNQGTIPIYVRVKELPEDLGDFLEVTEWPKFFKLTKKACWPKICQWIDQGKIYIQDPMTRYPVDFLEVESARQVLDLCAAPGGKTAQIAEKLANGGLVVAVDLPKRMRRLESNVRFFRNVCCLDADVLSNLKPVLEGRGLPIGYDRVLLDVPCSNTGVVRRKPDVKWRLQPDDFSKLPPLQLKMLNQAANWVKPGGLLVYSTCSIDPEENQAVVDEFLKKQPSFTLTQSHMSLPWIHNHDGGGAYALKKSEPASGLDQVIGRWPIKTR